MLSLDFKSSSGELVSVLDRLSLPEGGEVFSTSLFLLLPLLSLFAGFYGISSAFLSLDLLVLVPYFSNG